MAIRNRNNGNKKSSWIMLKNGTKRKQNHRFIVLHKSHTHIWNNYNGGFFQSCFVSFCVSWTNVVYVCVDSARHMRKMHMIIWYCKQQIMMDSARYIAVDVVVTHWVRATVPPFISEAIDWRKKWAIFFFYFCRRCVLWFKYGYFNVISKLMFQYARWAAHIIHSTQHTLHLCWSR